MKNVTITIDGKEYTAQMSDEAVAEITAEKKQTGYERGTQGDRYWCERGNGEVDLCCDDSEFDTEEYKAGNYYNDPQLAEDNARADTFMRRLRQWQALNDEPVDWNITVYNCDDKKYCIFYDYADMELHVDFDWSVRLPSAVYVSTREKAQKAIEVFKDELLWYFTEYCSRLDE